MSFPPKKNESSDAAFGERLSETLNAGTSDDQDRALLLSSAEIDCELSVEEQHELAQLVQCDSTRIQDFRKSSLLLSELLQSMPAGRLSYETLERMVPAAEASGDSYKTVAGSVRLSTFSLSPANVRRGDRQTGASWATVSAMLAAVMLMIGLMSQTGTDIVPRGLVSFSRPIDNPMPAESVSASVHAQGDDWQILVLKIGMTDRETVHEKVRQVAQATGLQMQTLDEGRRSRRSSMEILLTAAPADPRVFVDSVRQSGVVRSEEWNPAEIAKMDKRALVAAVRASMLTPTKSELHFGEVYLALPREPLVARSEPAVGAQPDQKDRLHHSERTSALHENSKRQPNIAPNVFVREFAAEASESAESSGTGLTADTDLSSVVQKASDMRRNSTAEEPGNGEDVSAPVVDSSADPASRFLVVFQFD